MSPTAFINSSVLSSCLSRPFCHSILKTESLQPTHVSSSRRRYVKPPPYMRTISNSSESEVTSIPSIRNRNNINNDDGDSDKREIISSLENVSYDVSGVRVIEDVSLNLYEGEIVCILGPSGSGKSTILRMIAGLSKPTTGKALYKGKQFKGVNPCISLVFQTFALYPWLTVLENVELGLSYTQSIVDKELLTLRAMQTIDIIGLDGYENAYPRELSGGMRQRVGFARALAVQPELLCMDEPFSALDVLTAQNLKSELLSLWQKGNVPTTSILIVTHSIEEAVTLADRIVILGKDPGHVRTILPINLDHPRNRKSSNFQAITDLVYTILSERDYNISSDDLAILNGVTLSPPPNTPAVYNNNNTSDSDSNYNSISSNQYQQYVQYQSSPSERTTSPSSMHMSQRYQQSLIQPNSNNNNSSSSNNNSLASNGIQSVHPTAMYLDGLNLSEPLQPVNIDLSIDDDSNNINNEIRYPQLPAVRLGSVSGFLSFIAEERVDLYLLGQRLQLDVNDLYPLIDAANILGLIELDEGDVRINRKGLKFEQASIDDRKNMVRESCLNSNNTKLISQIYRLLSEAQSQKLPQELIFDTILLKHFSPVESRKQLEIAIEWGRFAELFGYEALTGTLFLDTGDDITTDI